ncbi:isoprenoid synthase domain-containing protein [Ephemerocybe angulata]|uniref:(2E,6E)-farnesyl diphosphate synthase n=1 Tax=Ephemerocybe angulata TaxID=980116 RepID=A0A8H6M5J8_9AGAR|nr:isoprenoid synthase domain-containing protein [Tulosesus angulatus]
MSDKAARRAKFEQAFEKIRDELIEHVKGEGMPDEAVEWYKNNLDYNVPGGKLNRGMSVVDTAEIIKGSTLTETEYFRAALLGWCIELLQAFFLVADDMMDASITRRGQPCWYRLPKIGMVAINDACMLEGAIYHLLKKHFRKESYYADLLDIFHDTAYKTEFGQLVDLITAPEDHVDLSKFSLERHRLIVIYKTAFYSFYLPVACAMLMSGVPYPEDAPLALSILIPLGEYFQVQDDFLDFSATPEVLGKIGTDIVDNKCSWVVNTALLLTSPAQTANPFNPATTPERLREIRKVLEENYGRKERDAKGVNRAEERVKEVYEELGVRRAYEKYEERVVGVLRERIAAVEDREGGLKKEVFTSFLGKIYKRSK